MRLRSSTGGKSIYVNFLIIITLTVVITVIISSAILSFSFDKIATKLVYSYDLEELQQTGQRMVKMSATAKSLTYQIYSDYQISKYFLNTVNSTIADQISAMSQIRNYLLSMPFIDSIYVYDARADMFYISSEYKSIGGLKNRAEMDDKGILSVIDHYRDYKPFLPIPRNYSEGIDQPVTSSYTYLGYDYVADNSQLHYAIIVNIKPEWMNGISLSDPIPSTPKKMFIIDAKGNILFSNENIKELIASDKLKYMTDSQNPGYFLTPYKDAKSLLTYTSSDVQGWRYVQVSLYTEISSKIKQLRTRTLWISIGILAWGLMISYFISHRLYRPVHTILAKLGALESEKRDSAHILKQDFLRNILLGGETQNVSLLRDKLSRFGFPINSLQLKFRVVLLKIDRVADFHKQFNPHDRNLLKFAISNIGMEVCSNTFITESVYMGEESLILLLGQKEDEVLSSDRAVQEVMLSLYHSIRKYLDLSVTLTVSDVNDQIMFIPTMYKQVKEASLHRLFLGYGALIMAKDILKQKNKEYTLPKQKEKQLIESIMAGNADEAKKVFCDILEETSGYSFAVVQMVLSHLSMTVTSLLHAIQMDHFLIIESILDIDIVSLNQVETIQEVRHVFFRLFEEISSRLKVKRNTRHDDLQQRIDQIIESHCVNPDLTLNWIADELKMSATYVGRLYKQISLKSIPDVINEIRIKKAKELLLQTEWSVSEIALKTGFSSSSYFFRCFKRNVGFTPIEYRIKKRD